MKRFDLRSLLKTVGLCAGLWAIVAVVCLCIGSDGSFTWPAREFLRLRLHNVLIASLVGAALASAGVTFQAILRNPLADPYLLGASSGAMLGAYLWQFTAFSGIAMMLGQQAMAFAFAMTAVGLVLLLGRRNGRPDPITLLLVGVIVNAFNGSVFLLINELVKGPARPGAPMAFLIGALPSQLDVSDRVAAIVIIAGGWLLLFWIASRLNVALLSDTEAASLGVNISALRWSALIGASLVTAAAVAVAGPIGFIGLVGPHLARLIVGRDHRTLLPAATAMGAAGLALADATTRILSFYGPIGTNLSVGVITGLLGGPFFLLILRQTRRREQARAGVIA